MANSAVMTLRLAPELLSELKARARTEGRSTSAEVIHLIQRVIGVPKAHFDAPELSDFQSDGQANAHMFKESIATSIALYYGSDTVRDVASARPVKSTRKRVSQIKSK
jgi:hypothetical protein